MNNEIDTGKPVSEHDRIEVYEKTVQKQDFLVFISSNFFSCLQKKEYTGCHSHLKMMELIHSGMEELCNDPLITSLPISYSAMYENIKWTITVLKELLEDGKWEKAGNFTEFQLIPFLKEWREDTYFWLLIYPDKEKQAEYYADEFIENHKNTRIDRGQKYLVSIFIPVYNKVEYTRKCLDSLFKHTDFKKYPCELILLNDGSTDGTEEYFSQLPVKKVITLKQNVKTMIFSLMYRVCEGKYAVFVNNDTLLTAHWLDNLLFCIQSDPDIISVAPSTPHTSNRQGMVEDFTPENAEEKAEKHNRPIPYLWEERCRLMPVIAIYDIDKVNTIGFADRYFSTLEFWDDDFSLRARRAGYKQVLCLDTWCYHFGSVSGREDQLKYRTLQNGRSLFIAKHGVDPWGNNFTYDPYQLTHVETTIPEQPKEVSVLGIDPGFGADILQFKTQLRRMEKQAFFTFLLTDPMLAADLHPFNSPIIVPPSRLDLHRQLPEEAYHYISFGKELSNYPDYRELLKECALHLKQGGYLYFYVNNPYSFHRKKELAEERLLNGSLSVTMIQINELLAVLLTLGLKPQIRAISDPSAPAMRNPSYTEHLDRYFLLCKKQN